MRKNRTKHEAKKPRLAKRALALCFALIFVCSCLLPAFANSEAGALSGTQETVVEQPTNDPTEGGEDPVLLNEGGTDSTEGNEQDPPADNPTEGNEQNPPANNPTEDNKQPADEQSKNEGTTGETKPEEQPKNEGTTEETKPDEQTKPEGTTEEPKTEETKPEGTTEEPKTEETKPAESKPTTNTTGDTIEQGKATYTYRFWPDKIDAFELEAINDDVKSGTSLKDAAQSRVNMVPCTVLTVMTNANLRDYQANVQQPTKSGYEFAGWYTVDGTTEDEFSFEQNLNFEESQTIDVFAKWNELVTLQTTVTVDVDATLFGGEAAISLADEYSYEDDRMAAPTKTLTLDVEATNLSSNSELSVSSTSSSAIEDYCDDNELVPILTLDITPKDNSGKKTEPQKSSTVTISGLSKLELPNKLTMVHKKDDGEIEKIPAQYSNGTLTFETDSFSTFTVAGLGAVAEISDTPQYKPLYLYALKPGLSWDINNTDKTKDNNNWYGIGIAKVKTGYASELKGSTDIAAAIRDYTIVLQPYGPKGTTKNSYYQNKAKYTFTKSGSRDVVTKYYYDLQLYPDITRDGHTYSYWNGKGTPSDPLYYYTIEWLHLVESAGAPESGYNDPAMGTNHESGYFVYHLDSRITFSDTYNVDFAVKEPGSTVPVKLNLEKYSTTVAKGTSESEIVKPEEHGYNTNREGYVFDGWYKDANFTVKADFEGVINSNVVYYGRFIKVNAQDENYIVVEKNFKGITYAQIPDDFKVTVSNGSQTVELSKASLGCESNSTSDGVTLRWIMRGVGTGTYTVEEFGETIDGLKVDKKGTGQVSVSAANFSVDVFDYQKTCSTTRWPVKIQGNDNFIFAATLKKNGGVAVISRKQLSASERATVRKEVLNLKNKYGGPWSTPVAFYSVEEQAGANNAFVTAGGKITYDDANGEIVMSDTSVWQHVAILKYDLTEAENPEISITNKYTPATLDIQITKQVTSGDKTKDFKFKVTSDDFSAVNNVWLTVGSDSTQRKPQDDFYLKDGESATLHGLKEGYLFTIKEDYEYGTAGNYDTTATNNKKVEAGNAKNFSYLVVKEGNQLVLQPTEGSKSKNQLTVDGVIQPNITDGKVVVTNSAAATSLTVKKTVDDGNATAPTDAEFKFRLTVKNDVKVYQKVNLTKRGEGITEKSVVSGHKNQWEFTLKNGESVHISGIRIDDENVKVEEVGVDGTYYATKYSVNNGAAEIGTTAEISTATLSANQADGTTVEFTNTYSVPNLSSMTIKKVVTGAFGERTKEFAFSVKLNNANPALLNDVEFTGVTSTDSKESFKLTHGQSVELKNIPIDTTITITESNANDYDTKATNYDKANDKTFVYKVVNENGKAVLKSTGANAAEVAHNAIIVTNDFDGNPDTGVLLDTLPYLILLAVAVAGGVLVVVRKRKHRDE